LLAVGGGDGIYLFDESFAVIAHWPYQPFIRAISWSPDEVYLASASWDDSIWIWEVASGQAVHIETAIPCRPRSVAWHPFEQLVATASQCGEIYLFEPFTGELNSKMKHDEGNWPVNLAWHPLGDFLVFAEIGKYKAWEVEADEALWSMDDLYAIPSEYAEIVKVSISPDGETLATGGFYLRLWNSRTGELLQTLTNLPSLVAGLDWSADEQRIAVHMMDASIHIYEVRAAKLLQSYPVGIRVVGNEDIPDILDMENTLDWSPDGSKLASITDGSRVFIWDMETYYLLAILEWPVVGE
jgi:WD40 repeat protein